MWKQSYGCSVNKNSQEDGFMQTKINRFLSFALILCMASALLPAFPLSASAEPAAKIFVDNGKELNASNPFLVDGEPASAGPLNGTT